MLVRPSFGSDQTTSYSLATDLVETMGSTRFGWSYIYTHSGNCWSTAVCVLSSVGSGVPRVGCGDDPISKYSLIYHRQKSVKQCVLFEYQGEEPNQGEKPPRVGDHRTFKILYTWLGNCEQGSRLSQVLWKGTNPDMESLRRFHCTVLKTSIQSFPGCQRWTKRTL